MVNKFKDSELNQYIKNFSPPPSPHKNLKIQN